MNLSLMNFADNNCFLLASSFSFYRYIFPDWGSGHLLWYFSKEKDALSTTLASGVSSDHVKTACSFWGATDRQGFKNSHMSGLRRIWKLITIQEQADLWRCFSEKGNEIVKKTNKKNTRVFYRPVSLMLCLTAHSVPTFSLYTIVLSQTFGMIQLQVSTHSSCSHGSYNSGSFVHACQNLIIYSSILSAAHCDHSLQWIGLFMECTWTHTHTWSPNTSAHTSPGLYTPLSWTALGAIFLFPNLHINIFLLLP